VKTPVGMQLQNTGFQGKHGMTIKESGEQPLIKIGFENNPGEI